jgi:dTDP-4-dehydrorhamnose reductase
VFAGDDTHQGPFKEEDPTSPQSSLSWYAWTKAVAETLVTNGAIIRLSHPVSKDNQTKHFDYIHTILGLYDKGKLYPLFTDQIFPITYLPDLAAAIINIITSLSSAHEFTVHPSALRHSSYTSGLQILRSDGARNCAPYREVYHVVSVDGVSPFELARYAISKAKGVKDPKLPKTTFDAFVKHVSLPKRYAKYCAIDGSESRKKLGLSDRSWRKIVDCLFP